MDADRVVVRRNVAWDDFERLLEDKGERYVPKVKYLDGVLELVTPSPGHEKQKAWLGALVAVYGVERGLEMSSFGAWALKDKAQLAGLEPDDCYVFGPLKRMPKRPHLAIEIQWSRSAVNKLEIYRRLRVHEVWLWKRPNVIAVHVFRRGAWRELPRSPRFPELDLAWLCTFLDRPSMTQAMRELRAALEA